MTTPSPKLLPNVAWGALFGAATWSAYGVMEFIFSSVVFRVTRPYAIFPAWHWRLTILVILGYFVCGLLAGALAGLGVGLWRREGRRVDLLESAAGLTLVIAMIANLLAGQGVDHGGGVQLALGILFALLLLTSLGSPVWRDRLGWLTHPWIVSTVWLGAGLAFAILRSGVASQLGKRLDMAVYLVAGSLFIVAMAALFLGRIARRRPSAEKWPVRLGVFSCSAAGLLLAASAVLAFDTASVAGAESAGATSSPRTNLVLVVMDTVRADHLSLIGYRRDTTPNLEALAQDSVTYPNAFSASDITLTSHASLFTGMYPSWHGAYCRPPEAMYGRELSPKYPTLAEQFKANGYETLGVAANLYLRADFGLERGFDQFRIPRPVPMLPDESRYILRYPLRRALSYVTDTAQFDRLYTFGEDIDRELFAALDQRAHPSAPFFAFVNYMDAHFPYVPPAPFNRSYPGRRSGFTQDDLESEMELIAHGQGQPAGYRPHCEAEYDGGIAYEDAQIGKVVDWLKRHNAYDNTMIVITSDHGESFGERYRVGHANSPYQNLLHVPLLIKYPHSARRGAETQPVSLIDVAPTVLATLNVAVPESMQGVSLAGGAPAGRTIFAETFQNPVMHSPDCPDGCVTKIVVEWPMKYINNQTTGKPEFFDLSIDPNEQHNLFATQPERANVLGARLAAWAKALPQQTIQPKRINPGIEKGLQGNGYVAK